MIRSSLRDHGQACYWNRRGYYDNQSESYYNGYLPAALATGPASPIVPPRADDHDYIDIYLGIHQLSTASARYAYTLYFVFALILILLTIGHQSRYGGGTLGAYWHKFSIRRMVWKRKRSDRAKPLTGKKKRKQPFSFPSNSQLLAIFFLYAIPLIFCFIGADYIFPKSKLFDYRTSFPDLMKRATAPTVILSPAYTIEKTWWTSGSRNGLVAFCLMPLTVLFALKSPPFAIFSLSIFTHMFFDTLTLLHKWAGRLVWLVTALHVALWTVQLVGDKRGDATERTVFEVVWIYDKFIWGAVSFGALTLLTVLSIAPIRKRFYETFYIIHVTLVPLTLITAALHFPNRFWWPAAAGGLWALERLWRFLRYGWVNGWWGGLGNGERREKKKTKRESRDSSSSSKRISSSDGGEGKKLEQWEMNQMAETGDGLGMGRDEIMSMYDYASPTSPSAGNSPFNNHDAPLHPNPNPNSYAAQNGEFGQHSTNSKNRPPFGYGTGSSASHYTNGSVNGGYSDFKSDSTHEGESGSRAVDPLVADATPTPIPRSSSSPSAMRIALPRAGPPRAHSTFSIYSEALIPVPRPIRAPIPAGYALVQLLPSRMLRLTLRLPKPFRWAPGQNVLLQIREISIWTSHPFSIVSVYDEDVEQEIVLLVKARKGFTMDLWKETKKRMDEGPQMITNSTEPNSNSVAGTPSDRPQSYYFASSTKKLSTPKPVFFRALVDGPYGSSARVRWGDHSTVLIICGGSGVSFGIAILTYVCECIASRDKMGMGRGGKGGRHFITKRVRFLWIVRDFAEVLWVSNLIRRCMDMIPPDQLVIDIFVTNYRQSEKSVYLSQANLDADELAPPKPMFAKNSNRSRSNSRDSIASVLSNDSNTDLAYLADHGDADSDGDRRDSVLELTNWDEDQDEEEQERTLAERQLSINVKKEGRIRRAKSRKRAETKKARLTPAQSKEQYGDAMLDSSPSSAPPPPLPHSNSGLNPRSATASPRPQHASPSASFNASTNPYPEPSYTDKQPNSATPFRTTDDSTLFSPPSAFSRSKRFSVTSSMTADSYSQEPNLFGQPHRPSMTPSDSFNDAGSFVGGGGTESTRGLVGGAWDENRQSFVRSSVVGEDKAQFIDGEDEEDLNLVSELARPGRPKLEKIIAEEVENALGTIGIASCGPSSLNAVVRNIAASMISPARARQKGRAGHIGEIYTEEYGY
ncbi:FAD-binding domain-containing protein [Mrakia frigida]|uniref:ferric reductase family protein n=1 Tax=Mrakia frigida TaxID=29902 RepID=UPI003FCC25BE